VVVKSVGDYFITVMSGNKHGIFARVKKTN